MFDNREAISVLYLSLALLTLFIVFLIERILLSNLSKKRYNVQVWHHLLQKLKGSSSF